MSTRYRAIVTIRGALIEKVYRKTREGVRQSGIKKLTSWEPGAASLWPKHVVIQQEVENAWTNLETINYADVPKDQLEWRKREKR